MLKQCFDSIVEKLTNACIDRYRERLVSVVLFDRDGFFAGYLAGLRQRMRELGSRRVRSHGGYYWLLKPDLKPGEEVVL